ASNHFPQKDTVRIEVLYVEGCPNHQPVLDRLQNVLREDGVHVEVSQIQVKDADSAKALAFFGSPTIRINGQDIEPDCRGIVETGLACRRYAGGLPSAGLIRAALREARQE
ncbi:MAG TPA: DUF2703 domain-containing protein, partial [Bryobacteraceae bacterium]|nr:DUF2703 domain-containing protein [Bryobacteraceae bacterium]